MEHTFSMSSPPRPRPSQKIHNLSRASGLCSRLRTNRHRTMILRTLVVTTAFFISSIAAAETCDGVVSILRISDYVEGGTEVGLKEASIAHQQWYRDKGVSDNEQVVVPLMKYDEASDSLLNDATRVATLHVNSPAGRPADEAKGDEGWEEFVALYDKNTSVMEQYFLCLPTSLLAE